MENQDSSGYRRSLEDSMVNGKTLPEDTYKFLSGDFNIEGRVRKRGWLFMPSPLARRSYLYLQLLSSCQGPRTHYTIRSGINSYLLASTFSGKGELLYEGKPYTLEPGESFLIDCRKPHHYRAASREGWGYHIIHFNGFAMGDYFSQIEQGKSIKFAFPTESQFYAHLEKLFGLNAEMSGRNEMISSCLLTNMLTEIMLTLPDYDSGEIPRKIREVRDYIQENFAEAIHLEALSERFYISKYYLCHEFKKYIGLSPNEYLITVRVNKAKGLLQFTELRVCEISEITGFTSLNHFFYTFNKHEKMSPSEYRRQWKSDTG
jgi:AraC-like DNA-binding protein